MSHALHVTSAYRLIAFSMLIVGIVAESEYQHCRRGVSDQDVCVGDNGNQDTKSVHFLEGMARDGKYGAASRGQQQAYARMHPRIADAVRQRESVPHLVVADYGVPDCVASSKMASVVLAARNGLPVSFVFVDLPTNDWAACNSNLAALGMGGLQPLTAPAAFGNGSTVLSDSSSENGMLYKVPRNFFEQVVPAKSVDIAVSGSAFGWLSSTDGLPLPKGAYPGDDPAVVQHWLQRARDDWVTILSKRSVELKPGGAFIVTTLAATDELMDKTRAGITPYHTQAEYVGLMDQILQRLKMRREVTAEAVHNLTFGCMNLREDDLKAGFVADKAITLVPQSVRVHALPNPLWSASAIAVPEKRTEFAKKYVDELMAWSDLVLSSILGPFVVAKFRAELVAEIEAIAERLEYDYVVGEIIAVST